MPGVLQVPTQGHHLQVYASDAFLVDHVAAFLEDHPTPATTRILIATPAHRAALAGRLDPARLVVLDAAQTLAAFMVGDAPDPDLFLRHVGAPVRAAASAGPVRAFGEMVALLAQAGNFAAAIQLEHLWNRLIADLDVCLLCAYPASLFLAAEGREALREVCGTHSQVRLVEAEGHGGRDARLLEVLRQRSDALSLEVARRTQAEQELARERAELADFLENAMEGLHRVGPDGTILWANQAELDLLGYAREEVVGRPIHEFHADGDAIAGILERLRRGESVRDQPARLRCKDGSIRHVRITSNARMEGGRLLYSRCFTRDVTARRHLEWQLESRNRQQTVVARLGQTAISTPSLDDLFAIVAQEVAATLEVEFCKVLELAPDGNFRLRAGAGWAPGLVGTAIVEAGHSQAGFTLQSDAPVVVADLQTETRFSGPSLLHEHGVVSGMSVLLKGSKGPFGVLGAHSRAARAFTQDDINFLQAVANLLAAAIERDRVGTELRLHRENLESMVAQRTAALQEAVRELEAFSYTVSHDLRTPLRTIDGYSRLLLRRDAAALRPEARQMLEAVGDGAIQMGRLIESVLALSRVGRASLARERLDLGAMAEGILRQRAGQAPGRRVALDIEPGLTATGDRDLVRLALDNLLGNAWKFTGRTPAARITFGRVDGAFCVADNGAGFDMAHSKELFQPFHRLHSPDEFEGTGIGLATVARIVQRHGGSIWAESAAGQGARFFFTLP
jgi:PAS domain S-box-containing protein